MSERRATVIVRTQFAGTHCWPNAPDIPVNSFLRNKHRHMFHVIVEVQVFDSDRQIEFFDLKSRIDGIIAQHPSIGRGVSWASVPISLGAMSCEMIAEIILESVDSSLVNGYTHSDAGRFISVEVSEDGESSGKVYQIPS